MTRKSKHARNAVVAAVTVAIVSAAAAPSPGPRPPVRTSAEGRPALQPTPEVRLSVVRIGRVVGGRPSLIAPKERTGFASTPTAKRITNPEAVEGAIAAAVNQTRAANGLPQLRSSSELAAAADAHARALASAGAFTHSWPDGRPFVKWILPFYPLAGARKWTAGENLVWTTGSLTPAQAVQLWLNSPSHRRIMLAPDWVELGIGVVHAVGATGAFGGLNVDIGAAEFGRRS